MSKESAIESGVADRINACMKDCPKCQLANPDTAIRCDCGYDFASNTLQQSYLPAKQRRVGKMNTMRVFLWPALALAVVYTAIATWLLVGLTHDRDPESVTAGWLIIGAPWSWSGVLGRYYWLAVPLNGLTLYVLIVLGFAVCRKAVALNSK